MSCFVSIKILNFMVLNNNTTLLFRALHSTGWTAINIIMPVQCVTHCLLFLFPSLGTLYCHVVFYWIIQFFHYYYSIFTSYIKTPRSKLENKNIKWGIKHFKTQYQSTQNACVSFSIVKQRNRLIAILTL